MRKLKKRTKLFIVIIPLVLIVSAFWIFSIFIYNQNANQRFESYPPFMLKVSDFEGLNSKQYEFPSDKGQILMGSLYSAGDDQKGIIVLSHGFGDGGHNFYLEYINYFAQNGYYVFAYDATGTDDSEGDGVGGFPQGAIDLDYAISFIEKSGNFPDLPIGLFGHSWGGYNVSSVLTYHPEVEAVVACCGANKSSDYFEAVGKQEAGSFIYTMMPFVKIHEWMKFGKYATNTAMDGFESSDAAILLAHSEDDEMIPIQYGYDLFHEKYKDNERFTFLHFEDRGHDHFFDDPNNTYKDDLDEAINEWTDSLDYDYEKEENQQRFEKEKAEFIEKNLDRERWSTRIDTDLFEQLIEFYDANLSK